MPISTTPPTKSTSLKLLECFLLPSFGEKDVKELAEKGVEVGLCPQ